MKRLTPRLILTLGLLSPTLLAQAPKPAAPAPQPKRYLRIVSTPDEIRLEVALRRFTPAEGKGPDVWLSGVIHIGEAAYYQKIQKHLDQQKLVLFEGVGGPPFLDRNPTDAAGRIKRTQSGIRFVATMLQHHRAATGKYPPDLKSLKTWLSIKHPPYKVFISRASLDGWDRPLLYQAQDKTFTLVSAGADGAPGGTGANQDLSFDQQKPLRTEETKKLTAGLQADLAQMLGMKFQMNQLDYDKDHFQHCDIKSNAFNHNLKGQPDRPPGESTDLGLLMSAMDGSSVIYQVIKFTLKLLTFTKKSKSYVKLMMIETTGQVTGDLSKMPGLTPRMKKLMHEIIVKRNKIVMDDLTQALAAKNPAASISVFYGAGHMHDLEMRLIQDLKYKVADELWLTAMSVRPKETGLTAADITMIRQTVRAQMKIMNP